MTRNDRVAVPEWNVLSLRVVCVLCVALGAHAGFGARAVWGAEGDHALLIGCTTYPNHPDLRELYGPANDIPMWYSLLTDPNGFAFPSENVNRLLAWPADPERRPTYANIVKGFEDLIARAKPGSRVVIVMSGHGVQIPIPESQKDPLDPRNPEPDGLDEVFLAADVRLWEGATGLPGGITDNQVGAWLDQIETKGAHVLIIFDFCHSGTMTRGESRTAEPTPDRPEVSRVADPRALGITPEVFDQAARRAGRAVDAARRSGRRIEDESIVRRPRGRGSLVAFYAAQPFEEAPELPLPEGKPVARENYFGMLSFVLVQVIRQRQSPLSYDELQRLVATRYRAARATRPPTPFAEGDLNREVLGLTEWPNRPSIYLQRDEQGHYKIDAGALQGLTENSILAVRNLGVGGTVVGHVRVTSVRPADAVVAPTDYNGQPALPAEALKGNDVARCELVYKDFGNLQVRLFAEGPTVKEALDGLPEETRAMISQVGREPDADWILRVVSPRQARDEYGLAGLNAEEVFLLAGTGRSQGSDRTAPPSSPGTDGSVRVSRPRVFVRYPLDREALPLGLARDLPKVFTWQNVWRVANGVSAAEDGPTLGLSVEVVKLENETATDGEVLRDGRLKNGQEVLFRARNRGPSDLWVSAFYLDEDLGIKILYSAGVARGKDVTLSRGTITTEGGAFGREGLVVFAVPQSGNQAQPNFAVIEQEPLRVADRSKGAASKGGADTPFTRLLAGAAVNKGGTRGYTPKTSNAPAILTQSWVLLP